MTSDAGWSAQSLRNGVGVILRQSDFGVESLTGNYCGHVNDTYFLVNRPLPTDAKPGVCGRWWGLQPL
jgi:hypothetical protein